MRKSDFLFDCWYPVAMFPVWYSDNHKATLHKGVRVLLWVLGYFWFLVFLPLTAVFALLTMLLSILEEA